MKILPLVDREIEKLLEERNSRAMWAERVWKEAEKEEERYGEQALTLVRELLERARTNKVRITIAAGRETLTFTHDGRVFNGGGLEFSRDLRLLVRGGTLSLWLLHRALSGEVKVRVSEL